MAIRPQAPQNDDDDVTIGPAQEADHHDDATVGPDFDDATVGPDVDTDDNEDVTIDPDGDLTVEPDTEDRVDDPTIADRSTDADDMTVTPDDDLDETVAGGAGYEHSDLTAVENTDVDEDDRTIGIDGNVRDEDDDDQTIMGDLTEVTQQATDGSVEPAIADDDMTVMGDSIARDGATQVSDHDNDQTIATEIEETNLQQTRGSRTRFGRTRTDQTEPDRTQVEETSGGRTRKGKTRFSQQGTRMDDGRSRAGGSGQRRSRHGEDGPRYNMVDNFARGGMGNIWLAKDTMLKREIAYKELLPRAMRRSSIVERFIQEGQVTGQLEHPGIVPIYDLGYQEDGTPYYAMKLVRGTEMKDQIEALHRMPKNSADRHRAFVKLLGQFVDVCNALAFAHQRGVLHRDLKPQNVMIGGFGETLVLDWGLAKLLGRAEPGASTSGVTVTGEYDDRFSPDLDDDQDVVTGATSLTKNSSSTADSRGATRVTGQSAMDKTNIVSSEDVATTNIIDASEAGATRIVDTTKETTGRSGGAAAGSNEPPATKGLHGATGTVKTDARSEGTTTRYGSVMGTLAYMPPEQAEGKLDEMDARTDIYSLGAILYEILVNDAPIPRGKMQAMLDHVINKPITPPVEIDPGVPRPLNAIAMKALNKKIEDRYRSALDLARDVEDYLADEPVSVYEEPWYERWRRWAKRRPKLVAAWAATVVAVILGSVAWNWAESRRIENLRIAATAKGDQAQTEAASGRFDDAISLLNEAIGQVSEEDELAAVRTGLSNQLSGVEQLIAAAERQRIGNLQREIEQKIAEANVLAESVDSLDEARTLLSESLALIKNEAALVSLSSRTQSQLDDINARIAEVEAEQQAIAQFSRFRELAEQARYYFIVQTGDDVTRSLTTAAQYAVDAFAIYGGMSPDYLRIPPPYLSEEHHNEIRRTSYELLILLAEREEAIATGQGTDAESTAARQALQWISLAENLGLKSQALLRYKARYLGTAGESEASDLTLQEAQDFKPVTSLDFYFLAEEFRRENDFQNALNHYRRALQIDPNNFWSLYQMGLCHMLDGEPAAAVAAYTVCVSLRPEEAICYVSRGTAYGDINQTDDALSDFEKARELDPDFWAVFLNRGAVHLARKDYQAAEADFRKVIELRPQLAGPHHNLSMVYEAQQRYAEAEAEATAAISLDDSYFKALGTRAIARLQQGDSAGALADFTKVIELDQDPVRQAEAWKQIGLIHHRAERWAPALNAYDRSLTGNDADPATHRLRAETLLALNRDQDAVDAFGLYLELGGEPVADVFRARSLAQQKLGRFRESLADVARALELEPRASNMLVRRGWAMLLEANKLAEADFDAAVAANPENPDAWNGRGYARVMMGNVPGAIQDAEAGLKRAMVQAGSQGAAAWPNIYNAATIYAQAVRVVNADGKISAEIREKNVRQLTIRSLQIIMQAVQVGGASQQAAIVQTVQSDTALDPVRSSAEFRQVFGPREPERPEGSGAGEAAKRDAPDSKDQAGDKSDAGEADRSSK